MARLGTLWVAVAVLAAAWFSGNAGCSSSSGGSGGNGGTSGAGSGGLGGAPDGAAGVTTGGAGTGGGGSGTPASGGASANGSGGAAAGASGSLGGSSFAGAAGHQIGSGGAAGTPAAPGSGGATGAVGSGGATGAAGIPGENGGNPGTAGTGAAAAGGTTGVAGRAGVGGANAGGAGGAGGNVPPGTPDALILLDRSGSMDEAIDGSTCVGGCGASSKWSLVTTAMEPVLSHEDSTVRWGLKFFASANSSSSCEVTSGVEVAPALSTAAEITARIAATTPGSMTPTTAAVTAAGTYLASLSDGAPKFIVLITDGIPGCGTAACDPALNVANQCDDANAIAAVKSVHDTLGIPTFVVGVGIAPIGGGEATLSAMATNGGYPRAASPVYHPANSSADITSAFMAIAATIAP